MPAEPQLAVLVPAEVIPVDESLGAETDDEGPDEELEEEPDDAPESARPSQRAAPSPSASAISVPVATATAVPVKVVAGQQVATRSSVLPAIIIGCVLALAAAAILAVRRRAL